MNIISVIPISKSPLKKELTYFSSKSISAGDIVTVLVRKKEAKALVTKVESLAKNKISVRASDFELKKVLDVVSKSPLSSGFISAVTKTSEYFLTPVGATLFRMIPQDLLEKNHSKNRNVSETEKDSSPQTLAFQASFEDRVSYYKTYIRERFAKKESVFICLPSSQEIESWKNVLSKGIESYVYTIHSDMIKKKQKEALGAIEQEDHAMIIIGTPAFLWSLDESIGTIILEHESSPLYKTFVSPLFDMRTFVRFFAKDSGRTLVLGDTLLQIETLWEAKQGLLDTLLPLNFRFTGNSERSVISTIPEEGGKWKPITPELEDAIRNALNKKKNIFLFTLRKGLAPFTVCSDCKKILSCKSCNTPLTLYKESGDKRIFVCNTCKDTSETLTTCPYCNSWNLTPLGIGTESVEEYLRELFPDTPIYILDQTHAKTPVQAKKIIQEFESQEGAIMIGTELALHQSMQNVPLVAISSFDSLFGIPSFRIHERILHLLIHLDSLAEEQFLIQTKNPKSSILQTCKDNTFIQYYNAEITERENFNYPPFTTLIKIIPNTKTDKSEVKKIAETIFGTYNPNLFLTTHKNKKVPAILLKMSRELWNPFGKSLDQHLYQALEGLPLTWTVHVDPEQT